MASIQVGVWVEIVKAEVLFKLLFKLLSLDNISTPVAASLGDVCSLSILAFTSRSLYRLYSRAQAPKLLGLLALVLLIAAISAAVARRCRHTSTVILTGWTAILGAVLVEQPGGMVMEKAIGRYRLLAALQPLVNGSVKIAVLKCVYNF